MSVFDFLHECVEYLENAWNRFTGWLDALISKIIKSIENWLDSIFYLLEEGFILITNGLESWVISKAKAEDVIDDLEEKYDVEDMTDRQLGELCRQAFKNNADSTRNVPMTSEERRCWQQNIGNQEKMYTT